ncbi:hypothetical protein BH11PSE5_BH11PSE5_18220 [soil metagenome]
MVGPHVVPAISFDNQSPLLGDEICNISSYGLLAPKLNLTNLRISQMVPQKFFSIRHMTSEAFGIFKSVLRVSRQRPLTLPPLRGGPLPLPQGERGY